MYEASDFSQSRSAFGKQQTKKTNARKECASVKDILNCKKQIPIKLGNFLTFRSIRLIIIITIVMLRIFFVFFDDGVRILELDLRELLLTCPLSIHCASTEYPPCIL